MTNSSICARIGCTKTASFEKPLCYPHWREFDRFHIFECERCHRFDDGVGAMDVPYCFDCAQDIDVPVHIHAPIEYQTRYLYILKLDGGQFYVGQTNDLELRLAEHRDGLTKSTANRGKPRLVWFERWVGNREELDDEEQILTRLAKEEPRAIRRMVAEWQRPLKLLELDA